jgi:hypothetical protein
MARKIATPDLLIRVGDDGIRVGRTVEQLATAIEERAKRLHVVLTPHSLAVERALKLAMKVDATLAELQRRGDMRAFNQIYRKRRLEAQARNEKFMLYSTATAKLRATVIRCLANSHSQRETLHPSVLHFALQAELPWYRFPENTKSGVTTGETPDSNRTIV